MSKERIREAIRVMEEVYAKNLPFDMSDWFVDRKPNDCGTPACFAGWLARDPYFQALGLKGWPLGVVFDEKIYDDAVAAVLEISKSDAEELVYPHNYMGPNEDYPVTPDQVIEKLEELL